MLATALITLALAATGLAQEPPEGYRTVVIATSWDQGFVLQPKSPAQSGSALVLFVLTTPSHYRR